MAWRRRSGRLRCRVAAGRVWWRVLTPAVVTLLVTDGAGHALPGATVNVYQTVYAWEGACAVNEVCASAPVLTTAQEHGGVEW